MLVIMRGLLVGLVLGATLTGCNAIFGIEVHDELPAGDGGATTGTPSGGSGTGATGAGGEGVGASGASSGSGGDDCSDIPENCEDGKDNNCNEIPDDGCSIGAYVSALVGQDNWPGTQYYPVKTIAEGIQHAIDAGLSQVIVAQGDYYEQVTLVEGVDLTGGYHCETPDDCSWINNPTLYLSLIHI